MSKKDKLAKKGLKIVLGLLFFGIAFGLLMGFVIWG
jgi:predicted branched-subunit amino acid permease